MSPASFVIREQAGAVVGPILVHGSGGPITVSARARMLTAIRRATAGQPLVTIFEPAPGFVRAYPEGGELSATDRRIDLRGAELVSCTDGES